jgi:hypothetical protein
VNWNCGSTAGLIIAAYFSNLIQHFERGAANAKNLQSMNWVL